MSKGRGKTKKNLAGLDPAVAYNPLDRRHLGESVAMALLERPPQRLPPEPFLGSGIYAIYYTGAFEPYARIGEINRTKALLWPLYVGRAVPAGARKGDQLEASQEGSELFNRLKKHAQSITQATNLELADFMCRYLVVDDIFIPLGETLMIQKYSPVWNKVLDGFGINDPGKGRKDQQRSTWDTLHPGRPYATRLGPNSKTVETILGEVGDHIEHVLMSAPADER
jgi:hypothetical protein